jgi:hypothetical protein
MINRVKGSDSVRMDLRCEGITPDAFVQYASWAMQLPAASIEVNSGTDFYQ